MSDGMTFEKGINMMNCGNNIAYTLEDNSRFLSTEYKVLLNQADSYFLRCMKLEYNGRIQFYYLTEGDKPLSKLISSIEPDAFVAIVADLLNGILDVKNNGFLSCRNIDISFDHIFVDQNTLKVGLVYLPASISFYPDDSSFENELRTSLVKLISNNENLRSDKTMRLSSNLSNGLINLQELVLRLKGTKPSSGTKDSGQRPGKQKIRISAMNSPHKLVFEIDGNECVIGKKEGMVDLVINYNKMISRVHCKINKNEKGYSVTDLESANGTYVNNVRLQPKKSHPLKNGDILRLANSDFQITIS